MDWLWYCCLIIIIIPFESPIPVFCFVFGFSENSASCSHSAFKFMNSSTSFPVTFPLVWCIDGEQEDETSFDLFEISDITRRTLGAKQFRGQNLDAPAYRFIRFDHLPPVSPPILKQMLRQIQNNEGFVFVASIRQDRSSRGTLIGLEGPDGRRQFEIVSNGRANTLDLVYWADGSQNVVSFEDVDLSDSQWKNITLHVHGENANLFVGCSLIDSFILDEPFYEHLKAEGSRMYVAKGSIRENHFRVRQRMWIRTISQDLGTPYLSSICQLSQCPRNKIVVFTNPAIKV